MRFQNEGQLKRFQQAVMQALWEHNNEMKLIKAEHTDRDRALEASHDLTMGDAESIQGDDEDDESDEEDEEEDTGMREEHGEKDDSFNSQLAVGYKHDRSFVIRGSNISVFKHTPDNRLEAAAIISKVQTPKGKLFNPKKAMLHASDQSMILQNLDNPNSVYWMDLEVGKVVEEWKVHDNIPINNFAPEKVCDPSQLLESLARLAC